MHETIRFENENGLSATIELFGDPEKVTVELRRGSEVTRKYVIHKRFDIRNILDEFKLQVHNIGHGNFKNELEQFETTIKQAVEDLTLIANKYLNEDTLQITKVLEGRKTEAEKMERLNSFVKTKIIGDKK